MFFDFIEIGTSDFDTLIQQADDSVTGLSIDPIQLYLDRLPHPARCIKLAAAISNFDGDTVAYYVPPERIAALGLPDWLRGCNTIGAPHPSVEAVLREHGVAREAAVVEQPIPCARLGSVLASFEASGVYLLKLDTEGHDAVILNDFFDHAGRALWPQQLQFETNILSDQETIHLLIARLIGEGYDIVHARTGGADSDTVLRLNLRRLKGKSGFAAPVSGYHLGGYLPGYDPANPPHADTPEAAAEWCVQNGGAGVMRRAGRFQVGSGPYMEKAAAGDDVASWPYL